MKKFILLGLIFICSFSLKAFHYYGSEITCKQINGLTYLINFNFYGDLYGGWQWNNNLNLGIKQNYTNNPEFSIGAILTDTVKLYTGVYKIIYSALLTFPEPGNYTIFQGNCCWTFTSNVITTPGQVYFNQTMITVDTINGNSSPEFLNDPIVLAPINDTLYYNPLPFDKDGDILLWSLDTPRIFLHTEVTGYSVPSGNGGLNVSINPKTGEITWKPNAIGPFSTSIKVEEYRNGIKIGEVVRDMIFIVKPKGANITRANIDAATWNTDFYGNYIHYLTYDVPFDIIFDTYDPDNNIFSLEAKGYPFLVNNNPATFLTSSGSGFVTSTFSWIPTIDDVKIDPHLVVFRIYEEAVTDSLLRDKTVQLMVGDFSLGIENQNLNTIDNIFPNPTTGELFISVNVDRSADLKLIFTNELGQEVKRLDKQIKAGQNLIYLNDLNLPGGIYFINAEMEDKINVQKLVIE